MGLGKGFGKVILFGEHFVVYNIPSMVSSIEQTTTATAKLVEGKGGWSLDDRRPATPGYKEEKLEQQRESVERILKEMGIENSIDLTLAGDLIAASGIGASAASCVAIARALSDEFKLGLSDGRINEIAYEGERAYHGIPSGVDNTAATYGGLIWFVRGTPPRFEHISLREPVEIVMGNTGIVADTKVVVDGVRERKRQFPEKYDKLFKAADELVRDARRALEDFNLKLTGELMDKNHELLQAIGVSCEELDLLVKLARQNGALEAKMTGGGLGGHMVALTPGKELQGRVAKAIESEGFETLCTRIGVTA